MKFTLILAVFFLIFLSYSSLTLARGNSLRDEEKRILDDILNPSKYDKRIRPNVQNSTDPLWSSEGGPVIARLSVYGRSIESFSDDKAEIKMQMTVKLTWKDSRLAYQTQELRYISLREPSVLWLPDIFFSNERASFRTSVFTPNVEVRIIPDGSVLYSSTFTLINACPHDYTYYPFDRPRCKVRITTHATTDDLVILWKENSPFLVSWKAGEPDFSVHRFEADYCTSRSIAPEYSCVIASLRLKRVLPLNLVRNYTPSTLLVLVSYLALWLKSPSHRLFLTSITLLLFKIDATLSESKRPSKLITALDVWVGVCLGFSFASLLLTVVLERREQRQQGPCDGINANDVEKVEQNEMAKLIAEKTPRFLWLRKFKKLRQCRSKLPSIIRLVYPLAFAIFTLVYFIFVMNHGDEY